MKRKPTPAQLAARERFAEMARSGAFKRKAAKARKAKANPAKKTVSQKISQLTREGYPQKQAVAIALNEQRAGKVKRNPSDYRFEIRRANKAQTLDSVYATLAQAKSALDEIDRPPASFFLVDTQTGKHYFSFQAETKLPMVELRATAMQKAYKRNPRASNPAKYRDTARAVPESRVLYSVHLATQRPSIASGGLFTSKQNAMRVAQVIADSTGKTYAVSRLERK